MYNTVHREESSDHCHWNRISHICSCEHTYDADQEDEEEDDEEGSGIMWRAEIIYNSTK